MNKYEPVIGLEIHVELKTRSKMFCHCSADYFGKKPNTLTCPVCLGLPGAVPFTNSQAIKDCIMIGLALNCEVKENSRFERKNYFYPDLPKGYQISQYRWPLCINGYIDIGDTQGQQKRIRINRVHQEEDTGKLAHQDGMTVIDFNRSGVPLVEIVTEPDFSEVEQVKIYARQLQKIFRYLGVSEADMEKGDMRLEANVSVRKVGETGFPNYRVELKNINSFKFMGEAIQYEIRRQTEILEKGQTISQHTRGWNENKKETFVQREKEEANDYRYFPEPDLSPLKIDEIDQIRKGMPKLPNQIIKRLQDSFGLSLYQAQVISAEPFLVEYFEKVMTQGPDRNVSAQDVANYLINKSVDIEKVSPEDIISEIVNKRSGVISDTQILSQIIQEVIKENPQALADYKSGKMAAIGVLVGAVMKKTSGKAEAGLVKKLIQELFPAG